MDLSTSFEKFDQLADAPDAVAKLRELILEWAIRGDLSDRRAGDVNDPDWQSVTVTLDQFDTGDPADLPPFSLPEPWHWSTLRDAADCRAGSKVSPSEIKDSDWVLDLEDIDGATGAVVQFATFTQRSSLSTKAAFEPGDVLYGKLRPYLNKVVVAAKRGFCTTEIVPLRPRPFLASEFLRFYLRSQTFLRYAARKNYGMKMPRLGTKDLESAAIPIPPLAEQKRIVAKVDELVALCDRLEAQQQERETRHAALARAALARFAAAPTVANLKYLFDESFPIAPADLRKSILTLAVQGKLVPQDPKDEPAERLLKVAGKSQVNRCGETGEPPFPLPRGWSWLNVADAFEVAGGIQKTPHRTPRKNAFPYLGVGNVYRGRLDLTNVKEFELEPGELERRRLEVGDLLIIEGNGSFTEIGRCAKWTGEIKDCVHQNHVIRCRPCDARISDFVLLFLNSPNGMETMQRLAITSSGLYSLSVGKIRQIEIPLPPFAEQRRIVAKVEQLMALVDALEQQLATSRTTAEKLLTALVAELAVSPSNPLTSSHPLKPRVLMAAEDAALYQA
jgi:type I restriction enzyme S subunit